MAITRRSVLVGTAATILTAGLGGIASILAARPAEAAIIGGAAELALPGMLLDLGDYQARVPTGYIAQMGIDALATSDDPDLAATLPRTWQLVCTDESVQSVVTLAATPYVAGELNAEDIERLNGAEDIATEAALLLDCLTADAPLADGDPIYLDFLPYQNGDTAFNLLFFSGLQPGQVTAAAFLPGTDEAVCPTVLTATFDLDAIARKRREWGVFRDRRPEMYETLLSHGK